MESVKKASPGALNLFGARRGGESRLEEGGTPPVWNSGAGFLALVEARGKVLFMGRGFRER